MKKPAMTAAEGAAEERRLWMRKARIQKIQNLGMNDWGRGWNDALDQMLQYGEGRTKRNKAKEGGL